MRIFKPAYFSKNRKKRENAIAKLSEEKCIKLFRQDLHTFIDWEYERMYFRIALLERMSEETKLKLLEDKLTTTNEYGYEYGINSLKKGIIVRIHNKHSIEELYRRTQDTELRNLLIDYIEDRELLKQVALNSIGNRTDYERFTALRRSGSIDVATAIILGESERGALLEAALNYIDLEAPDPEIMKRIALHWFSGMDVKNGLKKALEEYLSTWQGQKLVRERIEELEHIEELDRLFRAATEPTLFWLLQNSNRERVLRKAFFTLRMRDIESTELHTYIRETMDERRRYLLEDALSSVRNNKDIPYFEAMLDTPRRQEALKYLACYYPNPENFYAKYGDINDVNDCIQELRSMGERRMQDKPASILRAMYRAGKFVEEIKKINGKRISAHADFNTLCGNEHRDFATNWIFKL